MMHPAELSVHSYLRKALDGDAGMSKENIEAIVADVAKALEKQFNGGPRDAFKLRMSNIGRPKCQLWFEKNDPETDEHKPTSFLLQMMLGDFVEALFKGLLREAGVKFKDNDKVTLNLGEGKDIKGEFDMILDNKLDDVKSASPWSYTNKFTNFETLAQGDSFGYVPQLVGYAKAANVGVGGWWVVNKSNGEFKYVSAEGVNEDKVIEDIEGTYDYINNDEPFERCFGAVPETYRKKPSGNMKLNSSCRFCAHKRKCWPTMQTLPSKVYSGNKEAPLVDYIL